MELTATMSAALQILHLLQNFTLDDPSSQIQMNVSKTIKALEEAIEERNRIKLPQNGTASGLTPEQCDSTIDSITHSDQDGCVFLQAVKNRDHGTAKLLLKIGAVYKESCGNTTALHAAVANNDLVMTKFLVENGVDKIAINNEGLTPLQMAVRKGFAEVVEYLTQKIPLKEFGADVDLIYSAAASGNIAILRILKRRSSTILDSSNRKRETPVLIAAARGDINSIKTLESLRANMYAIDVRRNSVIHKAAEGGHTELLRYLYRIPNMQFQKNVQNWYSNTPLHLALMNGHNDTVWELLNWEVNPMIRGEYGNTVLHSAALGNLDYYVKFFLEKINLRVDVRNDLGSTALHKAASVNASRAAEVLLKKEANPNAINLNTDTPLHLAAKSNAIEVAKLLLEFGANKSAVETIQSTPESIAEGKKHYALAYLILKYNRH